MIVCSLCWAKYLLRAIPCSPPEDLRSAANNYYYCTALRSSPQVIYSIAMTAPGSQYQILRWSCEHNYKLFLSDYTACMTLLQYEIIIVRSKYIKSSDKSVKVYGMYCHWSSQFDCILRRQRSLEATVLICEYIIGKGC